MPGTATGFPSGRAGKASRCSVPMHIANFRPSGAAGRTTASGWHLSRPLAGNGAHFSSARNWVRQLWLVTGYTNDSTGAALGNCVVTLFTSADNLPTAQVVSDAVGYYSISVDGNASLRFAVSYKTGAPDVAGTTVNTLVATLV